MLPTGLLWSGKLFIDTVLPFGLRSAPNAFNSVADELQWVLKATSISFNIASKQQLDFQEG